MMWLLVCPHQPLAALPQGAWGGLSLSPLEGEGQNWGAEVTRAWTLEMRSGSPQRFWGCWVRLGEGPEWALLSWAGRGALKSCA